MKLIEGLGSYLQILIWLISIGIISIGLHE